MDQELIMRNSGRSIDSLGVGWERGKNMDRPRSLLLAHVPADKGAPTSLTPSQEED